MAETPKFIALLEAFKKILREEPAVLLGSAPLATRGLRDVNDLDVLVRPESIDILAARGATDHDMHSLAFVLPVGTIQVSSQLHNFAANCGLTETQVWAGAERWKGWHVLSLPHCQIFKSVVRRRKDVDDLALIKQALTVKKAAP